MFLCLRACVCWYISIYLYIYISFVISGLPSNRPFVEIRAPLCAFETALSLPVWHSAITFHISASFRSSFHMSLSLTVIAHSPLGEKVGSFHHGTSRAPGAAIHKTNSAASLAGKRSRQSEDLSRPFLLLRQSHYFLLPQVPPKERQGKKGREMELE